MDIHSLLTIAQLTVTVLTAVNQALQIVERFQSQKRG
jgi:hypothetical protein